MPPRRSVAATLPPSDPTRSAHTLKQQRPPQAHIAFFGNADLMSSAQAMPQRWWLGLLICGAVHPLVAAPLPVREATTLAPRPDPSQDDLERAKDIPLDQNPRLAKISWLNPAHWFRAQMVARVKDHCSVQRASEWIGSISVVSSALIPPYPLPRSYTDALIPVAGHSVLLLELECAFSEQDDGDWLPGFWRGQRSQARARALPNTVCAPLALPTCADVSARAHRLL